MHDSPAIFDYTFSCVISQLIWSSKNSRKNHPGWIDSGMEYILTNTDVLTYNNE